MQVEHRDEEASGYRENGMRCKADVSRIVIEK